MKRLEEQPTFVRGTRLVPRLDEFVFGEGIAFTSGLCGQVLADEWHGFFAADTRMLSTYRFTVGGYPWKLLGRSEADTTHVEWVFQNPRIQQGSHVVPHGVLLLQLRRRLDRSLCDEFRIESFFHETARALFALQIDADFADIFEVKDRSIPPRLNVQRVFLTPHDLRLAYESKDFRRETRIAISGSQAPSMSGAQLVFDLELAPGRVWLCQLEISLQADGAPFPSVAAIAPSASPIPSAPAMESVPLVDVPYAQGTQDLRALAVFEHDEAPYVAAGVPWFMALFGRDTLVSALMAGIDGAWSAEGALAALARRQGRIVDDFRDEEPGKFPHEVRRGELARKGAIPHAAYYGTHDAPALYCLTLWNAWRWTGDAALLDAYLEVARTALSWCDTRGDRDGDGFLEYGTRSRQGYYNQGWKDSGDAIVHADGALAPLPIATVELQGYLFAARLAMSELLSVRGEQREAAHLAREAWRIKRLVEARFWMPDARHYALALDGNKRQVTSISSNPGHLLWCALPAPERARDVAARCLEPDLFSGWGLRTLSSAHPCYNPLSYQLGSVWPFDNALFAAGLVRYGLRAEAAVVIRAVLEAANAFERGRLPELFCGLPRASGLPVPYEQANSPQAWSAAAPVLFAQLFLGLVPDAPRGRAFLLPWLPEWLPRLSMRGIEVGRARIDVDVRRRGDAAVVEALRVEGDLEIVRGSPEAPLWGRPVRGPA